MRSHKIILFLILLIIATNCWAQTVKVDLHRQGLDAVNRQFTLTDTVIHLNAKEGAGIAWLANVSFTDGTIEFDVKGKDVYQESFVGMAFHGTSNSNYDVIYFRPFNFKADDAERRKHMLQYISLPEYDWPLLRDKFPNKYEQPVDPSPEPNNWVHAKIVVHDVTITVYVNHNDKPSLIVRQLGNANGTKLGFWVGNGSDGDFKNLVIDHKK